MPKTAFGLVLSGGGAKGAFEMGVWKALRESKIDIGAVVGTSVGALNAALVAQNDFEKSMDFWSHISIDQVLNLTKQMTNKSVDRWQNVEFSIFKAEFLKDLFDGGLDISPLRENLTRLISEDAIRKSPIRFGLVTVDLTSLAPRELMIEDIPKGKLIDYLLASAALPVFQKQEIDGKTYIDGGFFDNVPINLISKIGYNKIISVEFPAPGFRQTIKEKNLSLTTIENSELLGGILDFDIKTIHHSIQLGYLDAMRSLSLLEGKHFYLDVSQKSRILEKFNATLGKPLTTPTQEEKIKILLGIKDAISREDRLTLITNLMNTTVFKNRSLPLSLLEITGKNLEIPRLEKYSIDVFFQKILESFQNQLDQNLTLLENTQILEDFFIPTENRYRKYNFITFYIVFSSVKGHHSSKRMLTLLSRFTPEVTLSIVTLLYIHEMLKS
ncbi:MAG: patatin-like phospholipase family protein [Eubacteriaceae bacterium]